MPDVSFIEGIQREAAEREEADRMSRAFWKTTFRKKYSKTFGTEPRGKPLRQAPSTRVDDGYTQWGYAKQWSQRDKGIDATNPRVMLAETFGVLLGGTPGPGEYAKVASGFNSSSRFEERGKYTLKGKPRAPGKEASPEKVPVHLLSMASPSKDRMSNLTKRRKKPPLVSAVPMGVHLCGTKVNGRPIESLSDEVLRDEVKKFQQMPGPNNYAQADIPYFNGRVGRRSWGRKAPEWSMHTPVPKVRTLIDLHNPTRDIKEARAGPGVGSYNLASPIGKGVPTAFISPSPLPSRKFKPASLWPYDIGHGFEKTSRMTNVAKTLQTADMRKTASR